MAVLGQALAACQRLCQQRIWRHDAFSKFPGISPVIDLDKNDKIKEVTDGRDMESKECLSVARNNNGAHAKQDRKT